jgi:predicted dehydrogenase
MPKPILNVAMFGHAFMGRAHANAWRQVNHFFDLPYEVRPQVVVGRNAAAVQAAASELGFAEWAVDADAVLARPDIHVVDIGTPNDSHCDLTLRVIAAGKHVLCEKPLALTVAQAQRMAAAAEQAKVRHLIWHNYRRCPAASTAAGLIADGKLGDIRQVRAVYLQDWLHDAACPWLWRMERSRCGSGAHGDLNAHLIDMTRFLTGLEFAEVIGMEATFTKERRKPDGSGLAPVDVDDAFLFLAKLSNGATASFEATRVALGRKNWNQIEINGTKGSLVWNFEQMNELQFFDGADEARTQGFRRIMCLNGAAHPYAGHWWPDGHLIGYEHTFINTVADFLHSLHDGSEFRPDFRDGVANQEVLEAAQESVARRAWVQIQPSQRFAGRMQPTAPAQRVSPL